MTSSKEIGIVGSGKIGKGWAILFSEAGYRVNLFDVQEGLAVAAMAVIRDEILSLEKEGLKRRSAMSLEEQMELIRAVDRLEDCVRNAFYVQECVPENLALKQEVWRQLDACDMGSETVVCSSSSTIPPSQLTESLRHRATCLVVHPVNPLMLCPLVELVPAPWTRPEAVSCAYSLMEQCGRVPVRLTKEVVGFAVNRLQYAVVAECWRLVMDGVMSASDVDKVVSEGLGLRWAFFGPLTVTGLNGEGVEAHNRQYNAGFQNVCRSFGPPPDLEDEKLQQIARKILPVEKLDERRGFRDKALKELLKLKEKLLRENS